MTINTSRLNSFAGVDEVVANQRVRAYTITDPVATGGAPITNSLATSGGGLQYGTMWMQGTGVATNFTAAQTGLTITAAMLGGGIIVQSPNTTVTWTLDSATNILNYMNNNGAGVVVGDILVCDVINASATAADTITISFGSGGAFDSGQSGLVLPGGTSRTLFIRFTQLPPLTTNYIVYG